MIFVHEIPEITDNVSLHQFQSQSLNEQEIAFFQNYDKLRATFKYNLNQNSIKTIVQNKINILQKAQELEGYLKTNVEMMRLLLIKVNQHPKFTYKLSLSKKPDQYITEKCNTIEEACGCEIVMARYMYLLGLNNCSTPQAQRLKYSIIQTPNQIDQNDIQEALKLISTGWAPFQRMCNVMDDLLKSLVTKQKELIPELKMTIIFSIKLLIECNMNFFFLETLRPQKLYDQMAKVCKSSYTKLNDAYNRFNQIKDEISPNLIEYCLSAQCYFKIYGIWSILMKNEYDIKIDRTKEKSYNTLTAECHNIAKMITETAQEFYKQRTLSEYDQFTLQLISSLINPTIQKSLNIYKSNPQASCQSPDQLLMNQDSFDYTNVLKQQSQ